jgi:hypothetical protein
MWIWMSRLTESLQSLGMVLITADELLFGINNSDSRVEGRVFTFQVQ